MGAMLTLLLLTPLTLPPEPPSLLQLKAICNKCLSAAEGASGTGSVKASPKYKTRNKTHNRRHNGDAQHTSAEANTCRNSRLSFEVLLNAPHPPLNVNEASLMKPDIGA